MEVTCVAMSLSITCLQASLWRYSRASGPVSLATSTRAIAKGGQCRPPFARVWYPDAISSGVTDDVPSVIEGTADRWSGSMPIFAAVEAIFDAPTSSASCANTTFVE